MDPMGILAALGDKGLAAVGAGIVAYSWYNYFIYISFLLFYCFNTLFVILYFVFIIVQS